MTSFWMTSFSSEAAICGMVSRTVSLCPMTTRPQMQWAVPRAFPRYLIGQRVVLRAQGVFHGPTKDISEARLGATIPGELNGNPILELAFPLPANPQPLHLKPAI